MKNIGFNSFKKGWTNRLESIFWDKFRKKEKDLCMIYMFDFCSLKSDVRSDENGRLYLCYNYEQKDDSVNNILLKNIFQKLFGRSDKNEYLAYSKLKSNDDYREILMALFLLGNEIEDINLRNYLVDGNVSDYFIDFQKTGLDVEVLLENYIDGIIAEFQEVALKTKNAIFENEILLKNSEKFWNMPFLNHSN